MRNLYEVLGLPKSAPADDIKKTFKKLAKEFHPDRNKAPGAEQRFKEISAAYEVLGDEKKRALYDEFGEVSLRPGFDADKARAFRQGGGGFGGPGFGGFGGGFGEGEGGYSFEELFGDFFAGGRRGRGGPRPRRGRDYSSTVEVDLLAAIKGDETSVTLNRPGDPEPARLRVRLPAGIEDGQSIRLAGQGEPGQAGGPNGDVLLEIRVLPHPFLRRKGQDLELDVPITIHEAMAGAKVEVPTPWGRVKVTIPAGSQNGRRMRLRGKGLAARRDLAEGDLYLVLRPTPPETDEAEAMQLAESLQRFYTRDLRAALEL